MSSATRPRHAERSPQERQRAILGVAFSATVHLGLLAIVVSAPQPAASRVALTVDNARVEFSLESELETTTAGRGDDKAAGGAPAPSSDAPAARPKRIVRAQKPKRAPREKIEDAALGSETPTTSDSAAVPATSSTPQDEHGIGSLGVTGGSGQGNMIGDGLGRGAGGTGFGFGSPTKPVPLSGKRLRLPYTREAINANISGPVRVAILVNSRGGVSEARLLRGLGHGLDEIAVEKARQLRFRPALDARGRPRAERIVWTFHFKRPGEER